MEIATTILPITPKIALRTAPAKLGRRFTLDGSDELENHLAVTCDQVLDAVQKVIPPRKLEALLLGGGYGRGQGGVLQTEAGDQPYNDLEFYVCVRGNRFINEHRYRAPLHELAERLSAVANVEVEFKIISLAHLRRSAPSMFYYDLVMGHRWLWGVERLLAGCEHHRDASLIPLHEATRLLMNRCSGLLFARERLQHEPLTADDADFIGRNLAKAQLAFGEVVLTVFGQYHWSCVERHKRLQLLQPAEPLPWLAEVRHHHAAGVEFKLHPHRSIRSISELMTWHFELTAFSHLIWLWLENRRLDCNFQSARAYALGPEDKCPETSGWRNALINAKLFGPTAILQNRSFRHPRERILNVLAVLLWENLIPNDEMENWARKELACAKNRSSCLIDTYQTLWRHLN